MTSEGTPRAERPCVICFHGSGNDPLPSWDKFVALAREKYTVVLLDRGPEKISVEAANAGLLRTLEEMDQHRPYVLVAHSYGGAFAKMLLHQHPDAVAGMVLAETGQEGGLPAGVEKSLFTRTALGDKPLSVIRCNSLIARWKQLEADRGATGRTSPASELLDRERFLTACDYEDERLKRAQLKLSRTSRYIYLPDCGHHAIRDRPDVVLQELEWVMANLQPVHLPTNLWSRMKSSVASWIG